MASFLNVAAFGMGMRGTATNRLLALLALLGVLAVIFSCADASPHVMKVPQNRTKAPSGEVSANPKRHHRGMVNHKRLDQLIRQLNLSRSYLGNEKMNYIKKCKEGFDVQAGGQNITKVYSECVKRIGVTQNAIKCVLKRFRKSQFDVIHELRNLTRVKIAWEGAEIGNDNRTESLCHMFDIAKGILGQIDLTIGSSTKSSPLRPPICGNPTKNKNLGIVKGACVSETTTYMKWFKDLQQWSVLLEDLQKAKIHRNSSESGQKRRKSSLESGQRRGKSSSSSSSESENRSRRPKNKKNKSQERKMSRSPKKTTNQSSTTR